MNKNSRNRYLLKNTIVLSIGNFGSKLIVFFLVPLYTNILTKAEYGTIDLITIISTVIVPLITLNIQEAVLRYSMDKEIKENKILSIGLFIMFISIIIGVFCWPILNIIPLTSEYALLLVLYMLTLASSHIFLCYLRGKEKLLDYSIIGIIQTLIIALLNIYFLAVLKLGIKGYILAYIIAYVITLILSIIRGNILKSLKNFKIDKKLAKEMIKYSVILIPNSLMWWIMNSLDRVMVTSMVGIEANGIYAVSYKIPTIVVTLTTIFNQAWMFSAVKEKESADKDVYTNKIYTGLFNIVVTVSIGLLLILKPIMKIYVGRDFYIAWKYTSPLIVGTAFLTIGTFIANEYTAHKDSIGFLKSSTIGAIINIILNFVLIPISGPLGAAIATCISYIAVFLYRTYDTKKYVKLKIFDKKKTICLIALIISSILVYINGIYSYVLILLLLLINLIFTKNFWIRIIKNIYTKIFKKKVNNI